MKVCPFISHMQGEERSEVLTIESAEQTKKAKRNAAGGADEVVILGYDETGALRPGAATATISAASAKGSSPPTCLKDPCRFYIQEEGACAFESMLSTMKTMAVRKPDSGQAGDSAFPRVMKDLDKLWKFQTKSVTELISHMSELDVQQQKELESLKGELGAQQHEQLGSLKGELDARMDAASAILSDIARALERSMSESQLQTANLMKKVENLAANQGELLDFFKADKNRRDVEWMRSNKKEAHTLNNLGVTSFHNGAFETARVQFMKAIELDPDFAEVHNNLGLVCTEIGEEEKACEAFTRATQLNPDMAAAYGNLGYLLHKQGRYEQAVAMYNEALGRNARSSSAYTNLGNAYFKLGNNAEARLAWEKALEIDPGNEKASLYLKKLRAEKL